MNAMNKLAAAAAPVVLAFVPAPALAQENAVPDDAEMAGLMGMLGGMAETAPLTPEEEARLPAATALVDKIVPTGTMGEVMGGMFDGMLGPMLEALTSDPTSALAERLGLEAWALDLSEERAAKAIAIVDPAWQERRAREAEIFPVVMNEMMVSMEPAIKSVMSELYAIYFDDQELADIDAFFSTPSGASYARASFAMSSDKRMMAGMMQAMPAMFASLSSLETRLAEATADLPSPALFDELSPGDRVRLAEITGLSEAEIAEGMAMAASAAGN